MQAMVSDDPAVRDLLTRLDNDPTYRWSEDKVSALGYDLSTIRHTFKHTFGITFLDLARARRLQAGFTALSNGDRVIDAQLEAGFESGAAFRTAFAKMVVGKPSAFSDTALLRADWFQTKLGPMVAVADNTHLHLLEFADRKALPAELSRLQKAAGEIGFGTSEPLERTKAELTEYFDCQRAAFTVPLALHGTTFTKSVWQALMAVPAGEIQTYAGLGQKIGRPTATRAVARANGANQISILIPCQRVIGADGNLTGYGRVLWRKRKLIDLELQYK